MPTPAQTTAEALLLIQAQAQARQQVTELTQAAVAAEVRAFSGWYSPAQITALAARLAKVTRAGQKQTATSTDAFAGRILRLLVGRRPVAPQRVPLDGLRGVPLESVYGRLADNYRWLEATRGPDAPEARLDRGPDVDPFPRLTHEAILDRVVLRSELQVDDNLTLAFTRQWVEDIADVPEVTGYRRVVHPELVAVGSSAPGPVCGLCLVVSTRLYRKEDLLPVHARCRCSVAPVIGDPDGDGDPGAVINARDLRDIYRQAGGTASAKLKATKVFVAEHSELGPRLTFADHSHRTAADAATDDAVESAA